MKPLQSLQRFFILHQIVSMNVIRMSFLCVLVLVSTSFFAGAQRKIDVTKQFKVTGVVTQPVTFDIATIKKYPETALGDVVLKNHKGEDKNTAKNVKGVLLKMLLDSVHVKVEKPRYFSELIVVLVASDGYKNVYSWNELVNTEVGNHVYIITEKDGQGIDGMDGAIVVMSTSDINAGSRYLRGLDRIEIRRVE